MNVHGKWQIQQTGDSESVWTEIMLLLLFFFFQNLMGMTLSEASQVNKYAEYLSIDMQSIRSCQNTRQ